jgi:hypothetical protein
LNYFVLDQMGPFDWEGKVHISPVNHGEVRLISISTNLAKERSSDVCVCVCVWSSVTEKALTETTKSPFPPAQSWQKWLAHPRLKDEVDSLVTEAFIGGGR